MIPADKVQLAIPDRQFATNEDKARRLGDGLKRVSDPHVRMEPYSYKKHSVSGGKSPSSSNRSMQTVETTSHSEDRGPRAVARVRCR